MILTIVTQLCVCLCVYWCVRIVCISYYPSPKISVCVCICVSGTISGVPKAYKFVYTAIFKMFISRSKAKCVGSNGRYCAWLH